MRPYFVPSREAGLSKKGDNYGYVQNEAKINPSTKP
jgi:hypothetical protein